MYFDFGNKFAESVHMFDIIMLDMMKMAVQPRVLHVNLKGTGRNVITILLKKVNSDNEIARLVTMSNVCLTQFNIKKNTTMAENFVRKVNFFKFLYCNGTIFKILQKN